MISTRTEHRLRSFLHEPNKVVITDEARGLKRRTIDTKCSIFQSCVMINRLFPRSQSNGASSRFWSVLRSVVERCFPRIKASPLVAHIEDEIPSPPASFEDLVQAHRPSSGDQVTEDATELSTNRLIKCDLAVLTACNRQDFEKVADLASTSVSMQPIELGRDTLSTAHIVENVSHIPWHQTSYNAYSTSVHVINNATLYGAVGITGVGEYVISESLWHTTPDRHRYLQDGNQIKISSRYVEELDGFHVSLLTGAAESYWHSVIDATARLTLIPEYIMAKITSVLLPSTGIAQSELIKLYGLPEGVKARLVSPNESFRVQYLVYPSSIHHLFDYHPMPLNSFYDRLLSQMQNGAYENSFTSNFVYVDRRSSGLRRLVNENDLVQSLERLGFVAVCLEDLTVREQVVLFHNARVIIAPHGAGLTNIGFSKPGCWVIELMMDHYLNWCYRRIAAIRHLNYDCIIGHAIHTSGSGIDTIHAQPWSIKVEEVVAFATTCMSDCMGDF